jgi:pyrroline-5-carboxylate reductase
MTRPLKLIQIGAGSMGGALLQAWAEGDLLDKRGSAVIDPRPSPETEALCEKKGIGLNPAGDHAYDVCVLAVKPQQFPSVLPQLSWPSFGDTLFISIAAGTTAEEIGMLLKAQADSPRVLRVMPTLPAKVRRGVSLLARNPALSAEDEQAGEAMMRAAGEVHWCADEEALDRLMGVTGCAPAFFLRAVEGLAKAAEEEGASPEEALAMARETFLATAALLDADGRSPSALREAVTSPGGTTAAGLASLEEDGFAQSLPRAVRAAYRRAKELAGT